MEAASIPSSVLESPRRSIPDFLRQEMKPKGKLLTPFNVITGGIMLVTAVLLYIRFSQGIGAITNLDQRYPWGIWIGFDVVTGVAFAGAPMS